MDTKELVSWFRMAQTDPYYGTAIQARFEQAVDTIERLQGLNTDLELLAKKRATLLEQAKQERDAALAEVERLKRENNDFREERDLAMSELEPLVEQNQKLQAKLSVIPIATGAPRCTLCGVILDGALHKQFCSTCCAR